jgi:hypothetical protein
MKPMVAVQLNDNLHPLEGPDWKICKRQKVKEQQVKSNMVN